MKNDFEPLYELIWRKYDRENGKISDDILLSFPRNSNSESKEMIAAIGLYDSDEEMEELCCENNADFQLFTGILIMQKKDQEPEKSIKAE